MRIYLPKKRDIHRGHKEKIINLKKTGIITESLKIMGLL